MPPNGSDLLEADRLKGGGMKPGTWALKPGNHIFPVLTAVAGKQSDTERIRREETVRADVPVRGSPQIVRVVEDGNAELLIRHPSVIVDPVSALAPDPFLSAGTARIYHKARRGVQRLHDTDGKRALP